MISEQAKEGTDFIFNKAVKANLLLGADDTIEVVRELEKPPAEFPEQTIIVLTISSFLFRLLTFFHINDDAPTREYFCRGSTDKALTEVIAEIGNLCCGAMNRELLHHFTHLGMSTPYVLTNKSLVFLDELKPGFVGGYAITINNQIQLHATICLCEYAPIDFAVDMATAEEETGALELF